MPIHVKDRIPKRPGSISVKECDAHVGHLTRYDVPTLARVNGKQSLNLRTGRHEILTHSEARIKDFHIPLIADVNHFSSKHKGTPTHNQNEAQTDNAC
ncbi:MAG: hypothetical protein QNL45_07045 [Nitrospirota bacterium]|nr:hypothetical protein [Nitrospirota bacterium]